MKATTKASTTTAHLILTGASGYLGQHLLSHWIANGVLPPSSAADHGEHAVQFQISALYHKSETFPEALTEFCQTKKNHHAQHPTISEVTARCIDLTDPSESDMESLLSPDKACDAVILVHAAALSSPRACQADPETARAINVPKKFLNAVRGATITTTTSILVLSTDQVYDGTQNSGSYYKEDEMDGLKPVNIYGQTKLELENYLSKKQHQQTQKFSSSLMVALRSSIILGPPAPIDPDCAHGTFLDFCQSRGIAGEATTFFTNEYRSVVRVDRVISTLGGLVSKAVADTPSAALSSVVYNMGGPFRVNRMQLAQAVFDKFGYDSTLLLDAQQTSPMSPLDISMDSSLLLEDGILPKDEEAPQDSQTYLKELVDYVFGV